MINRRTFLMNSAVVAAGSMMGAKVFATGFNKKTIGIQLYSLRDELKGGLESVFKTICKAGYNSVEMFGFSATDGFFKNDTKQVAAWLKANKLIAPSGHYGIDLFEKDGQATVDAALALGHQYVVIPYLTEDMRTSLDDYKKIADKVNKAALLCKQNNLKLAYHNHDFEFKKWEGDVSGYDILLKETDKNLVDFEMDIFWVVTAGHDPIELFKANPGRFKMWHVKDMNKTDRKQQTEVGSGSIDWKPIFAAAKLSGMEYFFVEQENLPVPGAENIKKSNDFLKKQILASL